jgi:hypothetical protein
MRRRMLRPGANLLGRGAGKHVAEERVQIGRAFAEVFEVVGLRLVSRQDEQGAMVEALRGLVEQEG